MNLNFSLIVAGALLLNSALAQTPAPATPPPAPVIEPPVVTTAPASAPETKAAPAETKKAATKKTTPKKPAAKSTTTKKAAPEPPDNPQPATVKGDRVNVRGKASLVGEVVTQLKKGESITMLAEIPVKSPKAGEPAAWVRIAMPANVPVWINASFIDAATKTVKAARLNVRAGPGENFSVIGHLKKGESYKDLRQIDDWIEIETPPGTFGYVAGDLVTKGAALTSAPEIKPVAPVTPVETVKVEPAPAPATPTEPAVPTPPAPVTPTTEPAPVVTDPPAPAPFVAPATEEPLPRRVVTREGIIRYTVSLRAPSQFSLVDPDTSRTIAYLISEHKDLNFHHLVHQRYVLTGEEYLDKRWNNRTVLKVEKVEAAP